jgi:hypothetical protein
MREAAVEAAKQREDEPLKIAVEDEVERAPDRHVGGEIPPVREGLVDPDQQSASELAFDNPELDRDARALVALMIVNRFGGDSKKAFDNYDTDSGESENGLSVGELERLLRDAGVGGQAEKLARNLIGEDALAMDYDATISYDLFERAFAY